MFGKTFVSGDGPIFLPFGVYTAINPMTLTNSIPYAATIDRRIYYVSFCAAAYVQLTNDALNYWTIILERATDAQFICSFNTSTYAPDTYNNPRVTNFSVLTHDKTSKAIRVRVASTGAPGALYLLGATLEIK